MIGRAVVCVGVAAFAVAVASVVPAQAAPEPLESKFSHLVAAGYVTITGTGAVGVNGATVAAAAAALPVVNQSPVGYDRDLFPHWSRDAATGMSTRDEILARDLSEVTFTPDGTAVASGVFDDPYTGTRIPFTRTDSQAVQIDHLVPLAAAWTGGANLWDTDRRMAFANDPRNLWAVDGSANASKGDQLPGEWMPENVEIRCLYTAAVVWVLTDYELAVTALDRDAMVGQASQCSPTTPVTVAAAGATLAAGATVHARSDATPLVTFTVLGFVAVLTAAGFWQKRGR